MKGRILIRETQEAGGMQLQVLKEPKKMNTRLDVVETQVAEVTHNRVKTKKGHKYWFKKCHMSQQVK